MLKFDVLTKVRKWLTTSKDVSTEGKWFADAKSIKDLKDEIDGIGACQTLISSDITVSLAANTLTDIPSATNINIEKGVTYLLTGTMSPLANEVGLIIYLYVNNELFAPLSQQYRWIYTPFVTIIPPQNNNSTITLKAKNNTAISMVIRNVNLAKLSK